MNSFVNVLNNRIDQMFTKPNEKSEENEANPRMRSELHEVPTQVFCQRQSFPPSGGNVDELRGALPPSTRQKSWAETSPSTPKVWMGEVFIWSLQGGKRIRSSMVLDIIQSLRNNVDFNIQQYFVDAALCIEFIHNSSLIIDDLPCMDNDSIRRGKSSVHVKFGESSAQLAAISLLCDAFQCMLKGLDGMVNNGICTRRYGNKLTAILTHVISKNIGINGASGGQYMEVVLNNIVATNNFKEIVRNNILTDKENYAKLPIIRDYIDKKTGSFFELAFIFGYLLGGGSERKMKKIELLAKAFGILYQIVDDLEDQESDKEKKGAVNIVNECGYTIVEKLYRTEKQIFIKNMKTLKLWSEFFIDLINALDKRYTDVVDKMPKP